MFISYARVHSQQWSTYMVHGQLQILCAASAAGLNWQAPQHTPRDAMPLLDGLLQSRRQESFIFFLSCISHRRMCRSGLWRA